MIYGIHGRIRSGKTLFLTANLFIHYLYGRQVYSNYKLTFPDINELTDIGITKLMKQQYKLDITDYQLKKPVMLDLEDLLTDIKNYISIHHSTIGIDEVYLYAESRRSLDERNMFLSYLLLQSGKRDIDILVTSQQLRLEDVRIEDNCHYEIWCNRIPNDHHKALDGVELIVQDNYNYKIVSHSIWTDFHFYFDLYDTSEVVWTERQSIKDKDEHEIQKGISSMRNIIP